MFKTQLFVSHFPMVKKSISSIYCTPTPHIRFLAFLCVIAQTWKHFVYLYLDGFQGPQGGSWSRAQYGTAITTKKTTPFFTEVPQGGLNWCRRKNCRRLCENCGYCGKIAEIAVKLPNWSLGISEVQLEGTNKNFTNLVNLQHSCKFRAVIHFFPTKRSKKHVL